MSTILRFFRRPKAYVRYWGWIVCWHLEWHWVGETGSGGGGTRWTIPKACQEYHGIRGPSQLFGGFGSGRAEYVALTSIGQISLIERWVSCMAVRDGANRLSTSFGSE